MRFKNGLLFDLRGRYPSDLVAQWQALSTEFFAEAPRADLVELIVTDRFETVVSQWERDTPRVFGGEGATVYRASKADGTKASAKTIVLGESQSVVVVDVDATQFGSDTARWMLTHEAQHVVLHQHHTSAYAVQRRLGREFESPRPWEFVFTAQGAIDELRCERAVYLRRGPRTPTYHPADAQRLLGQLCTARSVSRNDLNHAHEIVVQVIDRFAVLAAYTAAAVDAGADTEERWGGVRELADVWELLRQLPPVGEAAESEDLWQRSLEVSEALDLVVRGHGVQLVFEGDGRSLYFR